MSLLRIARKTKEKQWIAINNFNWFLIINIGYEISLIRDLKNLGFRCTVGTNKAYSINKWVGCPPCSAPVVKPLLVAKTTGSVQENAEKKVHKRIQVVGFAGVGNWQNSVTSMQDA